MEAYIKENALKVPLFAGVDHDELLHIIRDCSLETFEAGRYIYRHGEYGEDCGIVISGLLRAELPERVAWDKSKRKVLLGEGDIFGEIAALSGYARTADVTAVKRTDVLIVTKETLFKLFDAFPSVKNEIDRLYCMRVFRSQLHSSTVFMGLPENIIEKLAEKASLLSCSQGETVFRQGDEADAFYLVRYGFVKITEKRDGGREKVLAYLKGGQYFGDMALMNEGGRRMATVTALDRTELMRISREDFNYIIQSVPRIRMNIEKNIKKIEEQNVRTREDGYLEKTLSTAIDSGFVRTRDILVIDTTKCIHCDNCVKACAALHNKQTRLVRKGTRLNNVLLIAASCRHCDDPTCMIKCPTGAIGRGFGGEIYHNDSCIGCGRCAKDCVYGNISMITLSGTEREKDMDKGFLDRFLKKRHGMETEAVQQDGKKRKKRREPVKCDMCREYPFMACVYNCPSGAARRMDPEKFISDVIGAG